MTKVERVGVPFGGSRLTVREIREVLQDRAWYHSEYPEDLVKEYKKTVKTDLIPSYNTRTMRLSKHIEEDLNYLSKQLGRPKTVISVMILSIHLAKPENRDTESEVNRLINELKSLGYDVYLKELDNNG